MGARGNALKKITAIVGFGTVVALLIYAFIDKEESQNDIEANTRYTIGLTVGHYYQYRGNKQLTYKYEVNNETYEGFTLYKNGIKSEGGRYYIAFSDANPENSKFLYNYAVPAEIDSAPVDGWKKLPKYEETFIDL